MIDGINEVFFSKEGLDTVFSDRRGRMAEGNGFGDSKAPRSEKAGGAFFVNVTYCVTDNR